MFHKRGSFPVRKRTGTLRMWRAREREPIWGSGGGAPSGSRGRAPGQGVRGANPPEAGSLLAFQRPITARKIASFTVSSKLRVCDVSSTNLLSVLATVFKLLSSSTGYQTFKHGFQISKHVRACRHVKIGPDFNVRSKADISQLNLPHVYICMLFYRRVIVVVWGYSCRSGIPGTSFKDVIDFICFERR